MKKFQSLTFLATLAIAIGMISWGSALNAQSTSTPSDQQAPSTQQPPSPEMPPSSQQTPSSQSPSQPPASTPDQSSPSAQPPASSQAPASQSPSSTPDATSPDAGAKSGNATASPSAGSSTDASGSQTFSGTVVKQGDKYVLKDDAGKTYDIDHQTDVAKFEGKRVRVQGTLDPSGKILVK